MARLYLFLVAAFFVTQGQCGSIYQSLYEYVSAQTQPFLVPQTDASKPIWVDFQLGPFDIEDVDKEENVVSSRFWFAYLWNSTIMWNPKDYNDILRIGLPGLTSFLPTVLSVNVLDASPTTPFKVVYWYNGMTGAYVMGKWRTLCADAKEDKCTLKILSSDYPNTVINLRAKEEQMFDFSKYMEPYFFKSSNYKLESESYAKGVETFKGIEGEFDKLEYTFSFKKRRTDQGDVQVFDL